MKKVFLSLALVASVLVSCNQKKEASNEVETPTEVVAETDLNVVVGNYEGILPCADCEGIKTTVALNSDNTYEITSVYLGEKGKGEEFKETGVWSLLNNVVTLKENGQAEVAKKLGVVENAVKYLDLDGNEITGALAEHYVLQKQ